MNRRTLIRRASVTAPATAAILSACGPAQNATPAGEQTSGQSSAQTASQTNANTPAQAGKPVRGGTLTIAMPRDVTNFDPVRQSDSYSAMVLNNTVDTLFEMDKDGSIVGRLVEKSENPQPNVYVFTLRKGITFQDGTPFNAEAVKFNLERHITDVRSVRNQDVKDITSIETPDAHTVRLTLRTPFAPFTSKLTFGAGYMLSPTAVQKLGEALQRDLTGAGSGPFKFASWQKDTSVTLERSDTYWRKDASGEALPYLDRLVMRPFPDENVRLTNIKTGDADVLVGNPPYKDIADLRRDTNLNVSEIAGIGYSLIMLNTEKEPFDSAAVRLAFSYAIDRAQIRKTVYFDNGKVLDTPIPELIPWAHDQSQPYGKRDLARARQEMASAGKQSVKFTFQIANSSPELQQIAELIKDQVKDVGLDMEIQLQDFATAIANGQAGNFHSLALGWSGDVDPDTVYSLYHTGAGFNFPKYSNPQADRLMSEGRQATDRNQRANAYKQLQKILFEDQPFIVYFNPPQIATTRKTVQNYPNNYNGYWGTRDLDKVWKAPR